ncbi:MAG TPA: choline/ethanolamine kinase family protein [Oscillatoriaceae cyanobacterium]
MSEERRSLHDGKNRDDWMMNSPIVELPSDLAGVVRTALGDRAIADVRLFKGGLSGAALYFFTHGDRPYVVRRGHPDRVARELACMRIASERGIAPKLFHTDESLGVAVMAYVNGDRHPRGPEHTARAARTLRQLHDGPAFEFESTPLETLRWVDGMIREKSGEGLSERIFAPVAVIAQATQAFATSAPCHADLNPSNLLDDGEQVYFIDWEAARMGDPYVDLAQLGVFYFPTPAMREALLEAYLG